MQSSGTCKLIRHVCALQSQCIVTNCAESPSPSANLLFRIELFLAVPTAVYSIALQPPKYMLCREFSRPPCHETHECKTQATLFVDKDHLFSQAFPCISVSLQRFLRARVAVSRHVHIPFGGIWHELHVLKLHWQNSCAVCS